MKIEMVIGNRESVTYAEFEPADPEIYVENFLSDWRRARTTGEAVFAEIRSLTSGDRLCVDLREVVSVAFTRMPKKARNA